MFIVNTANMRERGEGKAPLGVLKGEPGYCQVGYTCAYATGKTIMYQQKFSIQLLLRNVCVYNGIELKRVHIM